MAQLWDRESTRVTIERDVQLFDFHGQRETLALATNISSTGMFVATQQVCTVGTEAVLSSSLP